MTTLTGSTVALANAYYQAMGDKDMAGVAQHLHPDVHFIGPLAELVGKEAVLEAATRFATLIKSLTVRTGVGSEEQAMLAYDADFGEPIGTCRTAALVTFKDNLISRIELFYDARPFEKNLKKEAIFSSR